MKARSAQIRIGIGGWSFAPWRENFYPADLPQKRELEYASRQLSAIEINSTFYSNAARSSFAKWREQTPEGFVFAVKANRFTTHRRVLAEAREPVERFIDSGLAELGDKLGPILWQFPHNKKFQAEDLAAFLELLPAALDGRPLRHALDARHESFRCGEFLALARRRGAAVVFSESEDHPSFADLTSDFVYARLMRSRAGLKSGYPPAELAAWAERAKKWAEGGEPQDLPRVARAPAKSQPRDVFMFVISGAKERAPAAARELIRRL